MKEPLKRTPRTVKWKITHPNGLKVEKSASLYAWCKERGIGYWNITADHRNGKLHYKGFMFARV